MAGMHSLAGLRSTGAAARCLTSTICRCRRLPCAAFLLPVRAFSSTIISKLEPNGATGPTAERAAPAASAPQPSSFSAAAAPPPPPGHIEVVMGPMFAGKSTELLRRVSMYEAAGLCVAIIKSSKDDRYAADHVVTHGGERRRCHAAPSLAAFREQRAEVYAAADVLAVDEAQFFPDLTAFCATAADADGKRLVLAGLDGDFLRRRFGQVLDMVPLADAVTKLAAECRFCALEAEARGEGGGGEGRFPAAFSLRLAAEGGQEVVGGADKYAPVCRRHYVQLSPPGAVAPGGRRL